MWRESGKTILFVTHSIFEAVVLATQIIVLTARPELRAARTPVTLKEPRTLTDKTDIEFAAYARRSMDCSGWCYLRASPPAEYPRVGSRMSAYGTKRSLHARIVMNPLIAIADVD